MADENLEKKESLDSNSSEEKNEEAKVEAVDAKEPEANLEEEKVEDSNDNSSLDSKDEDKKKKDEVAKKIKKEIEKKQEKQEKLGIYRIGDYLKEEHKWENWVFIVVSILTLLLGALILNGALVVKDNMPVIGSHSKVFAWILVAFGGIGLLYAVWPFFKPAIPEFKKVTWLTMPKFVANCIRVFVFLIIFILLFIMYDYLMIELFGLIF